MAKYISLTKSKEVLVDDEDYEWLLQWKWFLCGRYAAARLKKSDDCKMIYMHRLIMNTPRGIEVDHINRNKLDCRRSNLRNVTRSENAKNVDWEAVVQTRKPYSNRLSHGGIYWRKRDSTWEVYAPIDNKTQYIGRYKDHTKAERAYQDILDSVLF